MFVSDIQRFSLDDGPGIRTTIFLSGCNMRCLWCHNPEMIDLSNEKQNCKVINIESVFKEIERDKKFYKNNGGVTFSGGEPLLQIAELKEILKLCKLNNINTAIETAGNYKYSLLEQIIEYIDLVIIDCKAVTESVHKKCTGVSNADILNNIQKMVEEEVNIRVRIPVIPDINISVNEISKIGRKLSAIGVKTVELIPFHKMGEHKYKLCGLEYTLQEIQPPTVKFRNMCVEQLQKYGIDSEWSR